MPRVLRGYMTVTYSSSDAEQIISVSIISMYRISLTTARAYVAGGRVYCRSSWDWGRGYTGID